MVPNIAAQYRERNITLSIKLPTKVINRRGQQRKEQIGEPLSIAYQIRGKVGMSSANIGSKAD